MRKLHLVALTCGVLLACTSPLTAGEVTAEGAFESLKALAGTWTGEPEGEGAEAEAETAGELVHQIQLSAAGTVVMETMRPGSPHEMINMYHLDGEDLLLTHYCAGGNQPRMRLDREQSTPEKLVFAFIGGTNLDPAVDAHIHAAEIRMLDADRIESNWWGWSAGKEAGKMTFHLARSSSPAE